MVLVGDIHNSLHLWQLEKIATDLIMFNNNILIKKDGYKSIEVVTQTNKLILPIEFGAVRVELASASDVIQKKLFSQYRKKYTKSKREGKNVIKIIAPETTAPKFGATMGYTWKIQNNIICLWP